MLLDNSCDDLEGDEYPSLLVVAVSMDDIFLFLIN